MERPLTKDIRPDGKPLDLKGYEQAGGYQALRKALKAMTPAQVVAEVKSANLRGRGGAGFPAGLKWSFIPAGPDARRPKFLVANADEMEPGTFKDRLFLERHPHQLLEGVMLAAYAIEAEAAYLYLRWEYRRAEQVLSQALTEARAAGYLGANVLGSSFRLDVHLHPSAGRYMCGEETAMLNALEGRRPTPRTKPPHPTTIGLFGRPTIVNNVETLCCVPHIVNRGAAWFAGLSRTACAGTKVYGLSGRVQRPGLWELPMGTTLREILFEHGGGMRPGFRFRGALPGGGSTDFITEDHLDIPMDFDSLPKVGSRLGTGTVIVLDDRTCPVGMAHNLMAFFARESCGWCTPCREGLSWTAHLLAALERGEGRPGDIERLEEHTRLITFGRTFCALAPGAMEPLQSALRHFRDDFERHVREKRCPWR
jgi:NADH-quinone oxidoreductase subunit F